MVKQPCYGCTERCAEPNCHTTCERYKESLEQLAIIKANKKRMNSDDAQSLLAEGVIRKKKGSNLKDIKWGLAR